MSTHKDQHVIPFKGKWAVKGAGNKKNTAVVKEKYDAVRIARKISKNQDSELVIHDLDGTISAKDSHGGDKFPPKG